MIRRTVVASRLSLHTLLVAVEAAIPRFSMILAAEASSSIASFCNSRSPVRPGKNEKRSSGV
jgi:hypothetical protein